MPSDLREGVLKRANLSNTIAAADSAPETLEGELTEADATLAAADRVAREAGVAIFSDEALALAAALEEQAAERCRRILAYLSLRLRFLGIGEGSSDWFPLPLDVANALLKLPRNTSVSPDEPGRDRWRAAFWSLLESASADISPGLRGSE
jgi:hypothetical protein